MEKVQTSAKGSASRVSQPDKGFTLIELLVVIAIISILASLLVPAVSSALDRGRTIKCLSHLSQVGKASYLWSNDHEYQVPNPCWLTTRPANRYYEPEDYAPLSSRLLGYLGEYPEGNGFVTMGNWRCPGYVMKHQYYTDDRLARNVGWYRRAFTRDIEDDYFGRSKSSGSAGPFVPGKEFSQLDGAFEGGFSMISIPLVFCWVYAGGRSPADTGSPNNTILQPPHNVDGRNFLFADSHVETIGFNDPKLEKLFGAGPFR